jgi:predicted RNA-binding protein YlxR (DUF448 family)
MSILLIQGNTLTIPLAVWYNLDCLDEQNTRALCFSKAAAVSTSVYCGQSALYDWTHVLAVRLGNGGDHRGRFAMRPNRKPCPQCGEEMNRQSRICVACHQKEHAKPDSYLLRICEVCGKEFTIHKTQVELGRGRFCSRSCSCSGVPRRKQLRERVSCWTCGKEFIRHSCAVNRSKTDKSFCCLECWYEYNHGENHAEWTGTATERQSFSGSTEWRKVVKFIKTRDRNQCQRCKSKRVPFHVHHIVSFAVKELRADPDNLILLCEKCHRWVHSNGNVSGEYLKQSRERLGLAALDAWKGGNGNGKATSLEGLPMFERSEP